MWLYMQVTKGKLLEDHIWPFIFNLIYLHASKMLELVAFWSPPSHRVTMHLGEIYGSNLFCEVVANVWMNASWNWENSGLCWKSQSDTAICCKNHLWIAERAVTQWCGNPWWCIGTLASRYYIYTLFVWPAHQCLRSIALWIFKYFSLLHSWQHWYDTSGPCCETSILKGDWKYLVQLFNFRKNPSTEKARPTQL